MAEYVEVLHRNNTRRPYKDMLLMHSPRIEESQIFMEHAITPSSLCKGMEEPSRAGVPSEVDYEDVFGGPPRFAALMSTPHLDSTPMAMLERAPARQFSLRTSSLPVFDLPVFRENAFSTTVHEGRSKSDAYDDMLDEEGHMLESFSPFNLPGASRSKASSFSTSQRMSPIHPTVAVAIQRGGDGATNLGPNLRTRHSNRPGAVKLSRRGSLSSASSFDESSGKLGDGYFTSLRNDAFISSVPSSPPQSSSCNHLKSTFGTNGSVGVGELMASAEVDDVFGGFPKRIYPQRLSQDSRTATNATETYNTKALEKAGLKDISDESRVCSSSSAAHASETSDTKKHIFSRSSSVNNGTDDRDQHEKEVMVDRQMDSSVLETSQTLVGKDANKYGGMHLTFQASFQLPTPRPPPILNTELKFKSWKDLASDVPVSHSHTSSMTVPSMVTPKNDVSEPFARQQSDKSLSVRQNTENLSHFSAAGHKGKVKPAEYTIDSEERELQASLANAWNIRQIERENHNAKFREEAPKILEVKDRETHREEQRQHSGGQLESSNIKQCDSMDLDNRENDANWKEWRKYGRRYRKEQSRAAALDGSLPKKDFDFEKQVPAPDRTRSLAEISVSCGAAKSPNIEEPLRAASEELLMERVLVSFEASSDPLASLDSQKKAIKGVSGTSEYLINEQALGRSGDVERVASLHGFMSGPSQDFVYIDEKNHLPLCIPVEDAECLIDLASCLDGFQGLEEETCERSNSRWEQHMLARERGAKALEEMQHRHAKLLHQQEEKQQSPEILDGKVKRWAAGKEGNLRALLSNLQHVLWAECGWQPIPLTDLIEVPDVKKAYRKATLFVHPDKVQQKGASIQQKYIAERVFDILQVCEANLARFQQALEYFGVASEGPRFIGINHVGLGPACLQQGVGGIHVWKHILVLN